MSLTTTTDEVRFEDARRAALLGSMGRSLPETSGTGVAPVTASHTAARLPRRSAETAVAANHPRRGPPGAARSDSSTVAPSRLLLDCIIAATRHEDIIAALSFLGLDQIASRLRYLKNLSEEDPDEPLMVLASLRNLALFLVSEHCSAAPGIGLTPEGLLQAEWRLPGGGILAMNFHPANMIQFAAVSGVQWDRQRQRVQGALPKDACVAAVSTFLPWRAS